MLGGFGLRNWPPHVQVINHKPRKHASYLTTQTAHIAYFTGTSGL